jgi:hypothetical protein
VDAVEVLVLFDGVQGYGSMHLLILEPPGERLAAARVVVQNRLHLKSNKQKGFKFI